MAGLAAAIDAADDLELAGQAAPSLGVSLTEVLQRGADVAIDFTVPDAAAAACETSISAGVPLILGTTGLKPDDLARYGDHAAGRGVQLFHASNFAIGAILMMRFAEEAARIWTVPRSSSSTPTRSVTPPRDIARHRRADRR